MVWNKQNLRVPLLWRLWCERSRKC